MSDGTSRILVVDDEMGMREGCRRILESEGYTVETADDGVAGLALVRDRADFVAALVDLKMPRMGGIEFIERVHEYDEDLLLLVITAYATIDTAVKATKRGAYGYIPKPFTPDELLLPVKNGLERRALSLETKRLREERERRLLEVAFERSKCSTVINCMIDGVLVVNRDRQVVLRNAAAARVIPGCADLRLPAPLAELDCAGLEALLTEALAAPSVPTIVSKEVMVPGGTHMVNASPVAEPNAGILGAVAVLRDITALKKLEEAKSMFVSMVAHELKSPLAAIEGYLNVILSGLVEMDPERVRHSMQRAQIRATTLRKMIDELMDLTAMQTGHFTVRRAPLDICRVVGEVVASYEERAKEEDIQLTLDCDGGAAGEQALADENAVRSVFANLIDNAIKYTPDKGYVHVHVEQNGLYVKVTVRDDGIGMTPEEKASAFEEFFRAKNEYASRMPGTGLGLTVVKRIVEMHQGRISVHSAPGEGSAFAVSLPIASHTGG